MSAVDDIVASLPIDQLAQQLGTDPATLTEAVETTVPALLGGLDANAQDPAGAASLLEALGQHDDQLATGQVDLAAVDTADGQKIAGHIFGGNEDHVVNQLGGQLNAVGGSSSLVKKLIPILAPIVLSYLAGQLGKKGGAAGAGAGAAGGGILGQVLSEVLTGASQGSTTRGGNSMGSIISDVLGGLLGGGRR